MAIHWIPCLVSFSKWFRNHPKKGKNPKTKTTRNNEIKFWKGYPTVLIKMDGGLGFLLRRTRFPRFRALKPAHADARKPTDPLPSPRARKKGTALGSPPCVWKTGTWVEGTALQTFSEKYGLPVVIWSHKTNVWTRMVVAPRFSSDVAGTKDSVPLCLQLKDQHYQILVPSDQGKVPSNWLKETSMWSLTFEVRAGRFPPLPHLWLPALPSHVPPRLFTPWYLDLACLVRLVPRRWLLSGLLPRCLQTLGNSAPGAGTPSVHTPLPHHPGLEGSLQKVDKSWVGHDSARAPPRRFPKGRPP